MKTLLLVLSTALLAAGGAYAHSWLEKEPEKHPAVTTFEVFYWKLQRNDLDAAGQLVAPGSEAELALAVDRAIATPDDTRDGVARGFALDLDVDTDEHAGAPAVFLAGEATVNVDPKGFASAFGVPEIHQVEARLVEHDGTWRVAAYRDLRLTR
jgi:hypothetical protein